MKKGIINFILCLIALSIFPARATSYCLPGTTASGESVREGICAGGDEYFGKTVYLFQRLPDGSIGKFIGMYECTDKGGTDAIKSGNVIDIWKPDKKACQEFMNLVYQDDCEGKIYIVVD